MENNFNRSHAGIPDGRKAFREYWPIQSGDESILYRHFSWTSAADFFILDTRQYRSVETDQSGANPGVTMLGARQKQWLKESLSASAASFKFIFSSVPFHGTFFNSDKWAGYRAERAELISYISKNRIKGVVFFSSDIHMGLDNTTDGLKEYVMGPIATPMNACRRQNIIDHFERSGRFFICDFNYILVNVIPEGKTLHAQVQFIDSENKIRYRDVITLKN